MPLLPPPSYPPSLASKGVGANAIRVLAPGNYLTLLAGSTAGTAGCANGIGTAATFNSPTALAAFTHPLTGARTAYVADYSNRVIRAIDLATAAVSTYAGSCGVQGIVDGWAGWASFVNPHGITVDARGVVYVADRGGYAVRAISTGRVVTTLAGTGVLSAGGLDAGNALTGGFNGINNLVVDSAGALYIGDVVGGRVRRAGRNLQVPAFTGNTSLVTIYGGTVGYVEGMGAAGKLSNLGTGVPTTSQAGLGIDLDAAGSVVFADTGNNRLRKLTCSLCPAGSYCAYAPSGINLGFTPTACVAGAFCPAGTGALSAAVNGCPTGFYCPLSSAAPTPCPNTTYGLGALKSTLVAGCSPAGSCVAGYYCPAGTPAYPGVPCGLGNYCPSGSAAPTPCPAFNTFDAVRGTANGPAFFVDTAACLNHCFSGGAGQLSMC